MKVMDSDLRELFAAVASALLLTLAFPPLNLYWLAWVALVPFLLVIYQAKTWTRAGQLGAIFGLSFFGVHLFWLTSLFSFVGWWSVVGWLALVIWQALFIVLFAIVLSCCSFFKAKFIYPLVTALLWVAVEYLRSSGPFGVTAGDLGYAQALCLPIVQLAARVSVYGLSLLLVLTNAIIVAWLVNPRRVRAGFAFCLVFFLALVYAFGLFEMQAKEGLDQAMIKVALVQPNIKQQDKLDPTKVMSTFELYARLTRQASKLHPDLVIWPETAVFAYLTNDAYFLSRLQSLTKETGVWLVFGTPYYESGKAYNSMVVMSPSGEVTGRYDKGHLVPFGEYLPFRSLLYSWLKRVGYYERDFSPSPPIKLMVKGQEIAAAVCFESVFPNLIRSRVTSLSRFILLVTNDAWFDGSAAAEFHLNCGILRAIENRKYFVQVATTGRTAVIDPWGRVIKKLQPYTQGILFTKIPGEKKIARSKLGIVLQ
ncbi:apolipoprotein N-acyltransferase [Candidatus Saganbacteria bacterium CG08_land_8_20_14_0_20_45_16]|uniref:Apolipoprotein N-acyltransferase n=1 Tax=Candidatus Saganbacteria bacterium CG08_land_8_20_14_0_20_45_16 TaxID=2014293 RepID=A0A2H0XVE0_UNCSA|nr:MAG: apolipoprotein N-acyltransferase [Candidatus Saganbacteria bacterium CG08_land_8_20_14_0_20_45_16]